MSWFDEAVARRRREQRTTASAKTRKTLPALDPQQQQQQEIAAFDPLVQRLLTEYGEHVFGKSLLQKRYLVRLERPGERPGAPPDALHNAQGDARKTWQWHWHLDSLVRDKRGLELHPVFSPAGIIQGFVLLSGQKRVDISSPDEEAIKEGLVSLYLEQ